MDGSFVYAGLLQAERADFLVGTLSRCWSHATSGARLLLHAREELEWLFAQPVVSATMATLGITQQDCVVLDRPTRLACVVTPAASIESGRLAYRAYARLAATVAIRLAGRTTPRQTRRPTLHVSSAREPSPAFEGEAQFDRVLADAGVEVVHPSEMSFASLLARVRGAGLLSSTSPDGVAGAGCQVAAFCEAGARTVLCAGRVSVDSVNVDALCGHETLYLRPSDRSDPETLGAALLRATGRMIAVRGWRDGAEGRDLGARATACTTSGGGDGSALVGQMLTGASQLVVSSGEFPWWQAEFADIVAVEEVRVHGPVDGPVRASGLLLFGSYDGRDWTMLGEREDASPIGGIDGSPHRFVSGDRPWLGRFLRLQSGGGVLALDQVEIFGAPASATAETAIDEARA